MRSSVAVSVLLFVSSIGGVALSQVRAERPAPQRAERVQVERAAPERPQIDRAPREVFRVRAEVERVGRPDRPAAVERPSRVVNDARPAAVDRGAALSARGEAVERPARVGVTTRLTQTQPGGGQQGGGRGGGGEQGGSGTTAGGLALPRAAIGAVACQPGSAHCGTRPAGADEAQPQQKKVYTDEEARAVAAAAERAAQRAGEAIKAAVKKAACERGVGDSCLRGGSSRGRLL